MEKINARLVLEFLEDRALEFEVFCDEQGFDHREAMDELAGIADGE